MNAVRRQRLILVVLLLVGVALAAALALFALRENINHYYSPSQIASGEAPVGKKIRGGGIVVGGSVRREEKGLKVFFKITDGLAEVEVEYEGILPDLFKEHQGVVGTGKVDEKGRFIAEELLAKHDETYMPPEVQKALDEAGAHKKTLYGEEGKEAEKQGEDSTNKGETYKQPQQKEEKAE